MISKKCSVKEYGWTVLCSVVVKLHCIAGLVSLLAFYSLVQNGVFTLEFHGNILPNYEKQAYSDLLCSYIEAVSMWENKINSKRKEGNGNEMLWVCYPATFFLIGLRVVLSHKDRSIQMRKHSSPYKTERKRLKGIPSVLLASICLWVLGVWYMYLTA